MNDQIEPADAARALSEIGRRREQVIRRTSAIPGWFWWYSAVMAIVLAAVGESQHGALLWTGTALIMAGVLAVTVLRLRAVRRAPARDDKLAPGAIPRVLASAAVFVAVVVGVTLATKLSLEAARVPYPGTIAVTVAMVGFVPGGQVLTRYHTAVMVGRPGGRG